MQQVNPKRHWWAVLLTISTVLLLLSACLQRTINDDELFPAQVGTFLRTSGPAVEAATQADFATYQGPQGAVTLYAKLVGVNNVNRALDELPPMSVDVNPDPGMGLREGVFFTFAEEYHAAWGNQDWVFVLSASTDAARRAFLSSYEY